MNEGLIPRRYAKAIYQFALEKGQTERLYAMMQSVVSGFASEGTLQQVMANPFVSDSDKSSLLMTASGATAADTTFADVVKLLSRNKRLSMVRDIALSYLEIYREANNIYLVDITTATELPQATLDRLKKVVESHLGGGTMEFSWHIDESVIGGFVININSERLDASVSNELKQLRLKLLSK